MNWRLKHWWHWGLAIVISFLAIKHLLVCLKDVPGDFASFWWAGRFFILGQNIYHNVPGAMPNVYLPLHALLMTPLALLPERIAFCFWQIGQLFTIGVSLRLLELFLNAQDQKSNDRYWLTLLLAFPGLLKNWIYGQYNHILLLGITIMLWLLKHEREIFAGMLLGILLSIKPFQILPLTAWLTIKRSWRAFFGSVVTALCGIFLLPSLVWGVEGMIALLNRWHQQVASHAFCVSWISGSLTSTLYRLLTPSNVANREGEQLFVNLFNLPTWTVTGFLAVLIGVFVSLTIWICLRPIKATPPLALLYEASWVLTVTLTLSPRTEGHHMVLLLPTFFLLAHCLFSFEHVRATLSRKVGLAWFFYTIINSDLIPKTLRIWLRTAYWAHAVALVLLCFSLLPLLGLVRQHR